MKTSFLSLFIFVLLFTSQHAFAQSQHGYAIDLLKGQGGVHGFKLAHQYYPTGLQSLLGDTRFYFETSVNLWQYNHGDQTQSNVVLAMSPVLLSQHLALTIPPYM